MAACVHYPQVNNKSSPGCITSPSFEAAMRRLKTFAGLWVLTLKCDLGHFSFTDIGGKLACRRFQLLV
ncbi:MAG: hypothetical protein CL604_11605 [Alteromonadaceae bacterium]|nr:hypothetical protein [Alteromonadaceae bacterium]